MQKHQKYRRNQIKEKNLTENQIDIRQSTECTYFSNGRKQLKVSEFLVRKIFEFIS